MTGEWLGGPDGEWLGDPESDCDAKNSEGYLCTLGQHSASAYHEAWGTEGDKPLRWWLDEPIDCHD